MNKKQKYVFFLLLILLFIINAIPFLYAAHKPQKKILVLYKQRDPSHKEIVGFLTGYLEQVGYAYDKQDVEEVLTTDYDMSPYSGIMTCYQTSQMIHGDRYPFWLVEQMEAGRRILIIGSYGAYQAMTKRPDGTYLEWNESTQTINTFFYPFGLEFFFAFTNDPQKIVMTKADKEYAQYQAPVTQEDLHYYQLFKSIHPENKVFFELERIDVLDSKSALNVITPFGGMIVEGYAYQWDPDEKKIILRVNLPKFIKEVFSANSPAVRKYQVKTHAELMRQHPLPERSEPGVPPKLKPTEMPRRVLVPYKKSEVETLLDFPLYRRAALILEYLGIIPVYRAVEDGLPDDEEMEHFRGIITWNTKPHMAQAQTYGDWLLRQIRNDKRVVILQEYGASYDLETQEPVTNQTDVFKALGVKFVARGTKREKYVPHVNMADPSMMGFERAFDPALIPYEDTYTSIDERNKIFLSFADRELGAVDLGIITVNGGICMSESAYHLPYDAARIAQFRQALKTGVEPDIPEKVALGAWVVNPYRFFSEALNLDQFPTPDVTTLNGSRIFYAHIDGDAFESVSLIDRAHLAGFIVYEDVLKRFDDIPTTASVITMPFETGGNQYYRPYVNLAREIFALPNVEMAVHTATHPFNWGSGDPFVTNPGEYPYEIETRMPDLVEEIWGAKLFADNNLAPPDKKTETIFWSGNTSPGVEALKITWKAGIHNINGGDPRYDDEYSSLAYTCPYSLLKGLYRQYMTSAQNDYVYSHFMRGDWGNLKKVLQHYTKTETPHRVLPMNLYYHFYAGIKKESIDALHHVYKYIRSIDAAPIYVRQYLEIAEDNYQTRIGYDGRSYWVENNGFLRTIRFNRKVHIDIELSRGVLGYYHHNNHTYVHLDGNQYREIVLATKAPSKPYLIQATQYIDHFDSDNSNLSFILQGFGRIFLKMGGFSPAEEYEIILDTSGENALRAILRADENGVLEYRTQLPAPSTTYQVAVGLKKEEQN